MGDAFSVEEIYRLGSVDLSPYASQVSFVEPDDVKVKFTTSEQWSFGTNTSDFTFSSNNLSDAALQHLRATIEAMFERGTESEVVPHEVPVVPTSTRRAIKLEGLE